VAFPFFTIGHSTRSIVEFTDLLRTAGVTLVVDIRKVPRSRTNPQYNTDVLSENLAPFQMGYEHIAELGGLRGKAKDVPRNVNGFWENQSFHNYADQALTDAFRGGLNQLIELGRERRTAMMCSEAVWWRCHRRLVADNLIAGGESVFHLMGKDKIEPAKITIGARISESGIGTYPADAGPVQTEAN
jgi:uncharacterized protein (DUF488 family)